MREIVRSALVAPLGQGHKRLQQGDSGSVDSSRAASAARASLLVLVIAILLVEVKPVAFGFTIDSTGPRGPLFVQEYVLLVLVVLGVASSRDFKPRNVRARGLRSNITVLAFWAALVLVSATLLGMPIAEGAWGNVRMMAEGLLAFIVVSGLEWTTREVVRILFALVCVMTIHSLVLWVDLLFANSLPFQTVILDDGGAPRFSGLFLEPSRAGFMVAIALVIACGLAMHASIGQARRSMCLIALPILSGGLLLTQTRGLILAGLLGVVYLLWSSRRVAWILLLGLFAGVVSVSGVYNQIGVLRVGLSRFSIAGGQVGVSRGDVYDASIDLIARYPLGSGAGALFAWSGASEIPHAHNMYLQVGVMFGIPGALLFLWWLYSVLRSSGRALRLSDAASARFASLLSLRSALVVILVGFLTEPFLITNVGLWFWCITGLLVAFSSSTNGATNSETFGM